MTVVKKFRLVNGNYKQVDSIEIEDMRDAESLAERLNALGFYDLIQLEFNGSVYAEYEQ